MRQFRGTQYGMLIWSLFFSAKRKKRDGTVKWESPQNPKYIYIDAPQWGQSHDVALASRSPLCPQAIVQSVTYSARLFSLPLSWHPRAFRRLLSCFLVLTLCSPLFRKLQVESESVETFTPPGIPSHPYLTHLLSHHAPIRLKIKKIHR